MDNNETGASACYGGGDIAGAIFGTLFGVVVVAALLWWLYRRGYLLKRKESQLVTEDPENKKDEYAFDNPAFKTADGAGCASAKPTSPLDHSWTSAKQNSLDKRKTVDDTCINTTTPRLVALRGSDFTGLGVEVYGGLKEGIFVKKVMPQGPAAGYVHTGDRITSITIDFKHIVQEDAMTILSYASPYNVQLELVNGEKLPQTQSPKPGHQALTHPLVRSSSQSDMNTIERNSRKKLFPGEDANSTLRMEQSSPTNLNKVLPTVHKENEKEPKKHSFKQQMKEIIEEKFQTKHAEVERKDSNAADGKKGHKFGIRVFPPAVNDKLFGKSPTKIQADNENNTNIEKKEFDDKKEKSPSPPVVKKRTKEPKPIPDVVVVESASTNTTSIPTEFQRQNSLTSSGIKRDSAGIPQEVPNFMMQAANAARDNRKSSSADADNKRKGKAPKPPQNEFDMDDSTVTTYTNVSIDVPDAVTTVSDSGFEVDSKKFNLSPRMNFSDNFAEEVLNCTIESIERFEDSHASYSSTPKSDRKKASLAESLTLDVHDSDSEQPPVGNKIELNSSDITVHQSSPSPPDNSEEALEDSNRRTASLGDLSKFEGQKSNPASNSNTLERAQSLEIPGEVVAVAAAGNGAVIVGATPTAGNKKRKVSTEGDVEIESKEPKLASGGDGLNSLQRNRLKGASDWGNLEDAINSGELLNSSSESESKVSTEDIVENGLNGMAPMVDITTTVVQMVDELAMANGVLLTAKPVDIEEDYEDEKRDDKVNVLTITDKVAPAVIVAEERKIEKDNEREHVSLTTISMDYNGVHPSEIEMNLNKTDHVKIANYDTNIPDDVKVSRYPFGSLERPKSDVLKKLLGQKEELENTPSVFISGDGETNKITIENNFHDVGEPISLTLINSTECHPVENDQTESSQVSPVFSSNLNGVSSINISSLEVDLTKSLNSKPFAIAPKFSLDNIVTISTESSQPSSIILIDDEKLDFSLQTLDDFDDSIENTTSPDTQLHFSSEINKSVIDTAPPVPEKPKMVNSFVTEITVKTPEVTQNGKHDEPPKITKKPPKPDKPTTPPSRIPVERRMSSEHSYIPRNTEIKFTTATYDSGKNHEKRPLGIDQIRSNFERSNSKTDVRSFERSNSRTDVVRPFERSNSKPDVRPFERSNSKTDARPFERSNSKTDVRPFERSNSKTDVRPFERSNSKTDVRPFERSNSKTDVRSVLERSNSKTEIPVLIRRTSIPSINLNNSVNSNPHATTNGNSNGSSPSTKASPSRIPVFNSASKLNNGHDSPRSPPPFSHHNNNNNINSINNNHIGNKVSVSITSIKNQAKHPSGKMNGN